MMKRRIAYCLAAAALFASQSGIAAPGDARAPGDPNRAITPDGRPIIVEPAYRVQPGYVVVEGAPRSAQIPGALSGWPPSDELLGQRPLPSQERYFERHEMATHTASCGLAYDEQPTYCPRG
jgi:hypothetical protein